MSILPAAAQKGFKDASSYEKHRPSYPSTAVSALLKNIGVEGQNGARVVDLAAGTGKFTELLAQRPEEFEILAVEPHEGMRAELEKKKLKGVKIVEGSSTDMPFNDGSVDAVVIAQAFHWFANESSLKEIHRVIRPGGALGMIWNVENYNQPKSWTPKSSYEEKMKSIIWSLDDSHGRFRHGKWKDVFEHQGLLNPLFSLPLGEESTEWTVWLSKGAIWDRFTTLSHISNLENQKRDQTREEVLNAIDNEEKSKDEQGNYGLHGTTFSVWASRV